MKPFQLTSHAVDEAARRGITDDQIASVMDNPDQVVPAAEGRKAYQSKTTVSDGRMMLIRAIVEEAGDELIVVTVYRTSKITKYWRGP